MSEVDQLYPLDKTPGRALIERMGGDYLKTEQRAREVAAFANGEMTAVLETLRKVTIAQKNMGDFWAYGLDKKKGAKPSRADLAKVTEISTASREAVNCAIAMLEIFGIKA